MKTLLSLFCCGMMLLVGGTARAECTPRDIARIAPADTHYIIHANIRALPSESEEVSLPALLRQQLDNLSLLDARLRDELRPHIEAVTIIRVRRPPPEQSAQLVLLELSGGVALLRNHEAFVEHSQPACRGFLYSEHTRLLHATTPVPPLILEQLSLLDLPPSPHWAVSVFGEHDPSFGWTRLDADDRSNLRSVGASVRFNGGQASVVLRVLCADPNTARSVGTVLATGGAQTNIDRQNVNLVHASHDDIPSEVVRDFLTFFQ